MEQKTVVVLGQARSGTSMTAAILHYLGVDLNPASVVRPEKPRGYFEDLQINLLTRDVSRDIHNNNMPFEALKEKYDGRIKDMISERSAGKAMWGWKSALTHECLGLYMPYLVNPYFVVVFRNILYNAQSLVVHIKDGYDEDPSIYDTLIKSARATLELVQALKKYRDVPTCFVSFEDIKKDAVKEARAMAEFLGVEMTPSMEEEINKLINPEHTTIPSQ